MGPSIELILFDLGGVLVELRDTLFPPDWFPGYTRFGLDEWVKHESALAFERGLIDADTFTQACISELNLQADPALVREYLIGFTVGPFAGVHELLASIDDRYRLAVLSNTNELHWPIITEEYGFAHFFEGMYASHLLNMAKPEPAIYQTVLSLLQIDADRVLFLDDNFNNVQAAGSLGMQAAQVKGLTEVRQCLHEKGLLSLA
ncbi:MAG: HAD family phosphatase [Pseudomonadota bacterium]